MLEKVVWEKEEKGTENETGSLGIKVTEQCVEELKWYIAEPHLRNQLDYNRKRRKWVEEKNGDAKRYVTSGILSGNSCWSSFQIRASSRHFVVSMYRDQGPAVSRWLDRAPTTRFLGLSRSRLTRFGSREIFNWTGYSVPTDADVVSSVEEDGRPANQSSTMRKSFIE